MTLSSNALRAGAAAIALLCGSSAGQAETASAFAIAKPAISQDAALSQDASSTTLAPLPGTREALTFTGEAAERQFAVFVPTSETSEAAKLVLAYQSAVSVMPETSVMRVFINDVPAGDVRLGAGVGQNLSVDLPPGSLQPGFNQIRVVVDQHHRVDCTAEATYELWTAIDPAKSGLSFQTARLPVQLVDELPALRRADRDGVTRIHAYLPAGASSDQVRRALSLAQSAVLMGHFENPQITFGPTADDAALEVLAGTMGTLPGAKPSWLAGNTSLPSLSFEPATPGGPAKLIVAATSADELDRNLAALAARSAGLAAGGTPQGLRALADLRGLALTSGSAVTLRDLGMTGRQFAGRFYRNEMDFQLPADFYPADYDNAVLSLNAAYAGGLSSGAQLLVRANGRVVSTIPLNSSRRGTIENQKLKIPLSTLRAGINTLSFEANLPNESDIACDAAVQSNPAARLMIADTSTLTIPNIARVGHVPNLSALGVGEAGGRDSSELTVLTRTLQPADLDVAGTFLAKMTASSGSAFGTRFVTSIPQDETPHLIAFGTFDKLPADLLSAVRVASPQQDLTRTEQPSGLFVGSANAGEVGAGDEPSSPSVDAPSDQTATIGNIVPSIDTDKLFKAFSEPVDISERLKTLGKNLSDWGVSLAGLDQSSWQEDVDPKTFYRPAADSSLVIAQGAARQTQGGAWTIVAAKDSDTLASGVDVLTSTSRWNEIDGAVTSLHGEGGIVRTSSWTDEQLFETQPRSFSNLRLIVAGWFSRHLQSYSLALLVTCLLLGATTHLFLRNVGERRS